MLAAIVGDVVGSRHESTGSRETGVALWNPECRFTDETLGTLALGQWLLESDGESAPADWLRGLCLDHVERGFGPACLHRLRRPMVQMAPSADSAAAARASAIAFWAGSDAEAMSLAHRSASPGHAHSDAEEGAQAAVWAIRHAFAHRDPARLLADASVRWSYGNLTESDPAAERKEHSFDPTARGTVPLAMVLAARGGSFEGTLRAALSMGGDADTLAALAAPIAEGLYGLDLDLAQRCVRRLEFWLDIRFFEILTAFHAHPRVRGFYAAHGRQVPPVGDWHAGGPLATDQPVL